MLDKAKSLLRYWKETLVFIISTVYFTIMTAPDMSWVNCASDANTYLRSAKFVELSHPTGAPLFNMFNWLVLKMFPFGNEFWRLSMVSAICAGIIAVLVFTLAKRYSDNPWKRLIAPLVFCASGMVVSQATIIETYMPMTLIWTLAFLFYTRGQHKAKYITLALGIGIHHLALIPLGIFFIADMVRLKNQGKMIPIEPKMFLPLLGLLFYIWIPFANSPPYNWIEGNSFSSYLNYFFSQGGLIGGLAVTQPDAILRLQDYIAVDGLSFALSGLLIIPAIIWAFKQKNIECRILFFLVIFVMVYYLTDMAPQVYRYQVVGFPFAALLAVKGSEIITKQWLQKAVVIAVVCSSVFLMGFNIQNYDIGRNLDKDMVARQYYNSLSELPQNCSVWTEHGGWWRGTVWLYNSEHNTDIKIIPVFGNKYDENIQFAKDALNSNTLWMQEYNGDRNWSSATVKANWSYLTRIEKSAKAEWDFTPGQVGTGWANPVDIITGRCEMTRWSTVTKSSQNAGFVVMWFFCGMMSEPITRFILGKWVKDKKKLKKISWITLVVIVGILMVFFAMAGMEVR